MTASPSPFYGLVFGVASQGQNNASVIMLQPQSFVPTIQRKKEDKGQNSSVKSGKEKTSPGRCSVITCSQAAFDEIHKKLLVQPSGTLLDTPSAIGTQVREILWPISFAAIVAGGEHKAVHLVDLGGGQGVHVLTE